MRLPIILGALGCVTAIVAAGPVSAQSSAPRPAVAGVQSGTQLNGTRVNGIRVNGIRINGGGENGLGRNGARFGAAPESSPTVADSGGFEALTVTLRDGRGLVAE